MGWTTFSMHEPVKEWFSKQWESNGDYEVLDSALVKRRTLYGAIKKKSTGEVFAAIYLVRWANGYYNFGYKDMTEHSGPYEDECPERIMNLLTPLDTEATDNGWAADWRKRVYELHAKRKSMKGVNLFITKDPVNFTNGYSYNTFKKIGRKIFAGTLDENKEFVASFPVKGFNPVNVELI